MQVLPQKTMRIVMRKMKHWIGTHPRKQGVLWQVCNIPTHITVLPDRQPAVILAQHRTLMIGINLGRCSMWYGLNRMISKIQHGI